MATGPAVYVLLSRDSTTGPATIVSIFADMQDANAHCLVLAKEASVDLENPDAGNKKPTPSELVRWEAPDGAGAWVERHTVIPRKTRTSAAELPGGPLKRNKSALYDNEDDDVIEVQERDNNYD